MPISSKLPLKKINTVHNLITFSIVFTNKIKIKTKVKQSMLLSMMINCLNYIDTTVLRGILSFNSSENKIEQPRSLLLLFIKFAVIKAAMSFKQIVCIGCRHESS